MRATIWTTPMQIIRTLAFLFGLGAMAFGQTAEQPAKAKTEATQDLAKNKSKKAKPKTPPKVEQPRPQPVVHDLAAMKKIVRVIEDSVDLNPTLVVWLIDRTTSAHDIVSEVTD